MSGRRMGWRIRKRMVDPPPPRGDAVAAEFQESPAAKQSSVGPLQNRIVQLETELAELKGSLVHGSAYAGWLIAGLHAADDRLKSSLTEVRDAMSFLIGKEMGD